MKWINTKVKLPEIGQWVLVSDEDGEIILAQIIDAHKQLRKTWPKKAEFKEVNFEWENCFSNCCDPQIAKLSTYPYWSEIPKGPVAK